MNSDSGLARSTVQKVWAHRSARWALIVAALLVAASIAGPWLWPYSGNEQPDVVGMKNLPPSWSHPMGTDAYSRDLLARVLHGGRFSLAIAGLSVLLSMTAGTAYGLVAGYAGGRVDTAMMRILDGLLSIPRVMLVLLVLTLHHPVPVYGLILLLGATGWFGVSRLVRAETLIAKRTGYIESARALGGSTSRVLVRHVLPNVITPVIVAATLAIGNVITLEAGLAYLGAGVRPPTPTWGSIFREGASYFSGAPGIPWWIAFFPGVAIVTTVLAFNVLGDALRDVLDPRQLLASRAPTASASVASLPPGN